MGDFNARVGTHNDYIGDDNDKHLPLDQDYTLDTIPNPRNSLDTTTDIRGKHLLEICIGAQLRILNGRKLGDSAGYHTSFQYNGCSVVDYGICSESLLNAIPYFKVHHFIGSLSDHCMVSLAVITEKPLRNTKQITLHDMPVKFKWNESSPETFKATLSLPPIQTLINEVKEQVHNCNTTETINEITNKITNILTETAKLSLKLKAKAPKKKRAPWNTSQLA